MCISEEIWLALCMLGNFLDSTSSADIFKKSFLKKNSFKNTNRVLNSLDPDQA